VKAKTLNGTILAIAVLALGSLSPLSAQTQLNLGDGMFNAHFNGNVNPVLTTLIPSIYCNGGPCYMANGSASGTGQMQSNGSYSVYSASNAPFDLSHNADDSFTITQSNPIYLAYSSSQGTLSGQLWLKSISKTDNHLQSTMTGVLTSPTGTFAPYFTNGANITFTVGLTFPLQVLWQVHGFTAVELQNGAITAAGSCPALSQGYWKTHPGQWKNGSSLTLGTNVYSNNQLLNLLQTPVRGDASVELSHQLIAALLNIANGTTGTPIQSVINDANNLIGSGLVPENVSSSSPVGQQMIGDAAILESYNLGNMTKACGQ
jgi:hypothetical protein